MSRLSPSVRTTMDVPVNCLGLSSASPSRMKKRKEPSASRPMRNTVASGKASQPKSMAGPILRLGCTPTVAPVSRRAMEQAAAPQCQNVMVFSPSSSDTGSPKNTGLPDSAMPTHMDSAP